MYKNYNVNQLVFPIDLEVKQQENDIAFVINDLVDIIPEEVFLNFLRKTGRPAYHPRMMLKIILCAYTQSVFSGRKIEALLKDSIRMMWLSQGYESSYRTINRFRVDPDVQGILRQLFVQFRCQLINVQIATEGQYALAYDIFPNPTDTRTLIPFLDKIESQFFKLPEYIVADAGYGSEQNYDDILKKRGRTPLITYNNYIKEQKRKYRKNKFNTAILSFSRFSVRGKSKVENEIGFALMAVNLRKYTAKIINPGFRACG